MFVWFSFVRFSRWNWWWAPRDEAQPSTVNVTLRLTRRKCFVVNRHEPSGARTRVLGLRWRFRHAAHARFPLINKTTVKDMTSIPSGRNLHHQAICWPGEPQNRKKITSASKIRAPAHRKQVREELCQRQKRWPSASYESMKNQYTLNPMISGTHNISSAPITSINI